MPRADNRVCKGQLMPPLPRRARLSCSGTPRTAKRESLDFCKIGWKAICLAGLLFLTVGCQNKMFHVKRIPIDPTARELQLSAMHGYGTSSAQCATGIQFTLQGRTSGRPLRRSYGGRSDGPLSITDLDAGTYEVWAGGPTCGSYRTDVLIADGERVVAVFDISAAHREAESSGVDLTSLEEPARDTLSVLGAIGLVSMDLWAPWAAGHH